MNFVVKYFSVVRDFAEYRSLLNHRTMPAVLPLIMQVKQTKAFFFSFMCCPPLYDFLRYIALLKYTIQSKVYQAYKNPVN